ncbi:STAS domain-containing protein [Streptomyces sp. NPDC052225]|uniref:STAS domain-containing protein n=1 Tax=Streptomyces sp. NPDC052225 TaxID=3154949 RepID=UPI003415EA71
MPPWAVQTVDTGDCVLLRVSGELDVVTAPRMEPVLRSLHARACELDLSQVPFIDSSGINLLIRHHRQADQEGGSLRVIAASRPVCRVLDIVGTSRLLGGPLPPRG